MQDSGKWIHGQMHSQCRAGSINNDSAVPESKAFLMERECQKRSAIKLRKLQVTYNGLNEALPPEAAADTTTYSLCKQVKAEGA